MKKVIYADNAATTQIDSKAYQVLKKSLIDDFGNPSQLYKIAKKTKKKLSEAREKIALAINARPEEIFFTSGGTESNNWVIKQYSKETYEIVTSEIEHHSILNACLSMQKLGHNVVYLKPNMDGLISPEQLKKNISKRTRLVSIMFANNEIGTVQDIKELCKIAHNKNVLFHTDAVQAIGHVKIDVKELDVDFLSASAHKFNGPKGIGFLYIKSGIKINPLLSGGSQEKNLRAGTENVPYILAMSKALENNFVSIEKNERKIKKLEKQFFFALGSEIDYIRNGKNQLPGLISLSFKNADGEAIMQSLDLMGIAISTGAACNSKKKELSHVLTSINVDKRYINGTVRISIGKNNSTSDIYDIARALNKIIKISN